MNMAYRLLTLRAWIVIFSESVKKLFQMLKAGVKRKGVKREFGKSLLESHGKCRKVIFQFFTEAKEEGGCSHCLSLL